MTKGPNKNAKHENSGRNGLDTPRPTPTPGYHDKPRSMSAWNVTHLLFSVLWLSTMQPTVPDDDPHRIGDRTDTSTKYPYCVGRQLSLRRPSWVVKQAFLWTWSVTIIITPRRCRQGPSVNDAECASPNHALRSRGKWCPGERFLGFFASATQMPCLQRVKERDIERTNGMLL